MKFTMLQSALLESLQKVSGVVPARSTTPVLENILFEVDDNHLRLTGTDLEVTISTEVRTESTEAPGALALPARVITEMIRSLPDIPIHFEADHTNRIKITTDQGLYQVSGIGKDSYPAKPTFSDERKVVVDSRLLARMFKKTLFAVSSEELRPALMGVFLQILPGEFRMVATDGHRLSKIVDRGFQTSEPPTKMIIPPKAVQIALKNLGEEGETELTLDETGVRFNFGETSLYTRLVEGEYPDYERVIPRDNEKKLVVDKNLLMASVKRVSLFSSALTHQIRFSLSSGQLVINSEDMDVGGEAREALPVEYQDEEMEIGYNAQYLLDILRHVDTDEVVFQLKSPVRAALVMPQSQEGDENFIMLIMPIKLGS